MWKCLLTGCIVTWAWSLAKGQYMVSWLLTGAPKQRYWQNRETANIGLVSSVGSSVVVETVSETSHLCWNNETIRFKSSLTSILIESTYLTLNMNKIWGCFKVQVGWKNAFYGETGSRKGLGETVTIKKTFFNLHFKCQQNNNLSVFNVQIIRLYSLGSWNFYVPDNFKI